MADRDVTSSKGMFSRIKGACRDVASAIQGQRYAWEHRGEPRAIYARPTASGLKIHLGSGPINLQGWINIDARAYPHVHVVSEGFALKEFSDASISEIYLCHVLEHFSFAEARTLLATLRTKVIEGGIIRIAVPSFDSLVDVYQASNRNIDSIKFALMGGQDYEYNFHKSVYTDAELRSVLADCGYGAIEAWTTLEDFGVDIGDWSSGTFRTPKGEVPISLNLKGVRI